MLKVLRNKKTARKIWLGLAIIIVPAFTLWGFGGAFRSREENIPLGKIYGHSISPLELKDAVDAVRVRALMRFGDKYEEMRKYLNFENEAINRLMLLHEARIGKIKVTDKEVINQIENYPFLQVKGQFDSKNYNQILRYGLHIEPREFEEQERQNMMIAKLYNQNTAGINLNDNQIIEEYRKANKKISVYYLASIPAEFSKEMSVSENELTEYYKKNSLQFKEPLSLNIEYISLEDKQKSGNALNLIKKNGGFEKIAKDYGVPIKETGFFSQTDPIPGLGWSAAISELAGKLKVGQNAEPLSLDNKYYFMRLKDRKEPAIPEFNKIKTKVKDAFIKKKTGEIAKKKIEDALKLAKDTGAKTDLSLIAKKIGVKASSTDLFLFNSYIEGIGASDKLWLTADKLKTDEISDIISLPSGYYIIKVKQSPGIDEKKFAEEKLGFSQKLLDQKKEEAFSKFLEGLRKKFYNP